MERTYESVMDENLIREINRKCPWDQGLFVEPSNIDVNEKRLVVYYRHNTSGVSGGSCWDSSNPQYYVNDEPVPEWVALDMVIQQVLPNVSYMKYKGLDKLIKTSEETDYQYYGNCDHYIIKWIAVEDLIDYLQD